MGVKNIPRTASITVIVVSLIVIAVLLSSHMMPETTVTETSSENIIETSTSPTTVQTGLTSAGQDESNKETVTIETTTTTTTVAHTEASIIVEREEVSSWLKELNVTNKIIGVYNGLPLHILLPREAVETLFENGVQAFYSNKTLIDESVKNIYKMVQERCKLYQYAGLKYDRERSLVTWNAIEPKPGEHHFELLDALVNATQECGIELVFTINPCRDYNMEKMGEGFYQMEDIFCSANPQPYLDDMEAYKRFLKMVAERYDGDGIDDMPGLREPIRYWEIGNAPDIIFWKDPESYMMLFTASYEALKEAYGEIEFYIMIGGLENYQNLFSEEFELVFEDIINKTNIVNIHSYRDMMQSNWNTMDFANELKEINNYLKYRKLEAKIWYTEFGCYQNDEGIHLVQRDPSGVETEISLPPKTEEDQAAWLIKHVALGLTNNVEKFFINLEGRSDDPVLSGSLYIPLEQGDASSETKDCVFEGERNIMYKPRLWLYTSKLLAYLLQDCNGTEIRGEICVFDCANRDDVLIAWHDDGIMQLDLEELGFTPKNTIDLYGNIGNFTGNVIDVNEMPIILVGEITEPWKLEEIKELEQPWPGTPLPGEEGWVKIILTNSTYKIAEPAENRGWFKTGQEADIVLNWFGFNSSGGPLFLNHPMGIASDGTHLLVADTRNNRILIWNHLPTGNEEPDIVLGQKDFYSCEPGSTMDKLRWPVDVATDGKRIVVADTYNDRILIWNSFPEKNGEPADIVIEDIDWPWSVWTDGEKLIVTNTMIEPKVLIWTSFPVTSDEKPDIILRNDDFGTPRNIVSDGKTYLIIGDHNAKNTPRGGNFIWLSFPETGDEPYDAYIGGEVLWSSTVIGDDLFAIANHIPLYIKDFRKLKGEYDLIELMDEGVAKAFGNLFLQDGDGSGAVHVYNGTHEITYISLYNGGRIVGYFGKPEDRKPDFVICSDNVMTNPFTDVYYFIENGKPISNGETLIVLGEFGRKVAVWKNIPDEDGALPDVVYVLPISPNGGDIDDDGKIYVAGQGGIAVWESINDIISGKEPTIITNIPASPECQLKDIELDEKYVYIASGNTILVYQKPFDPEAEPWKIIEMEDNVIAISSNGDTIVAVLSNSKIGLASVDSIETGDVTWTFIDYHFNLPEDAFIDKEGHLFVSDTCFNRVLIWNTLPIKGDEPPDIVLGQDSFEPGPPKYTRDGLFWPYGVWFDGNYLWVGEYKFSHRVLRFSPIEE